MNISAGDRGLCQVHRRNLPPRPITRILILLAATMAAAISSASAVNLTQLLNEPGIMETEPASFLKSGNLLFYAYDSDYYKLDCIYSSGQAYALSLGGNESFVTDDNAAGTVVGFAKNIHGHERAFQWIGGLTSELPTLGGLTSRAYAVNESGTVVGTSRASTGDSRPVMWNATGAHTELVSLGGTGGEALTINASGVIAGWSNTDNGQAHATLWNGGVPIDLTAAAGSSYTAGKAVKVFDSGAVLYWSTRSGDMGLSWFLYTNTGALPLAAVISESTPVIWNEAGQILLANTANQVLVYDGAQLRNMSEVGDLTDYSFPLFISPTGMAGFQVSGASNVSYVYRGNAVTSLKPEGGYLGALAVSNTDQVVGEYWDGNRYSAFSWTPGSAGITNLGGSFPGGSAAIGVNSAGDVVGYYFSDLGFHPFLYRNGALVDLGSPVGVYAQLVNEAGLVVGTRLNNVGTRDALLLIPEDQGENSAPTANAGQDQSVEATGPMTSVSLSGSGNDADGDTLTYQWLIGSTVVATGASASVDLPLGTHTLTLKVTDPQGAFGTDTVDVTVEDTTAPTLTGVPTTLVAPATSVSGAVVTYNAVATDLVDGVVPVWTSTASGSLFPLGPTTVNLSAEDSSGNGATGSFVVRVEFSWSGFQAPHNKSAKAGRPVSVNFKLTGASAGIANANAVFSYRRVGSDSFTSQGTFTYESGPKRYSYDWDTTGLAPGTYEFQVELGDGVERKQQYILK